MPNRPSLAQELCILGPLEVRRGGRPLNLSAAKPRSLLCALLVRLGEVVSTDDLVDALWPEDPPTSARGLLQVYVSQLRRALGDGVILTRSPGYVLALPPEQVDSRRFETLCVSARDTLEGGRPAEASALLDEACALWRGPPLADVRGAAFAAHEIARLDELHLAALEDRIEAGLALGRQADVVPELRSLVAAHPLRERLRGQLMVALYRGGRQADALEAYQEARRTLVDQLGVEPGPELRRLHGALLNQDTSLESQTHGEQIGVPRVLTSLVGRDEELAALERLVARDDVRLVTLTGAGGAGKTRLAVALAARAAERLRATAAFVQLADVRDPALVLPSIAQAVGVRESGEGLVEGLAAWCRHRTAVLIIDNVEHLRACGAALAELLAAAPGSTAVLTSRIPLALSGEHVFPVPPLEVPERGASFDRIASSDAVRLLVDRAAAARPGFELTAETADDVAEICIRLDGLPLAIELAASRLRVLGLRDLRRRLEQALPLLTGGPGDLPERQRTLRTTIEWSEQLLDPAERELLARLGVFAGSFTLDAAHDVTAPPDVDSTGTIDRLARLVDAGLVRVVDGEEQRYRMLHVVSEYALERLTEAGALGDLRRRHAEHYATLAEEIEPTLLGAESAAGLARLRADDDNFRAALELARSTGDDQLLLRLSLALWRGWWVHGRLSEGSMWLEAALAGAETEAADAPARARALRVAAGLTWAQGDYDRAIEQARAALELAELLGDGATALAALNVLGIASFQGDHALGEEYLERSRTLALELGRDRDVCVALLNLGGLAIDDGRYGEARERIGAALELSRTLQADELTGICLLDLGMLALVEDDPRTAAPALAEALRIFRTLDFRENVGCCLAGFAAVAVKRGHDAQSARLLGAAGKLRVESGARLDPLQQSVDDQTRALVRGRMVEIAFATALAEGEALTVDEACSESGALHAVQDPGLGRSAAGHP